MDRKKFLASLAAVSVLTAADGLPSIKPVSKKIKPPRLNKGDTVGLIAPGSYISESELKDSITNIEALGLKPFYTERILNRKGYFSADDAERLSDLHLMFNDDNVKAVICARGGYGCARLLPLIDYDLIISNPKILIGYSDVTALLWGIYSQTGLVTFHGPVGISTYNAFTVNYLNSVLFEAAGNVSMISVPEGTDSIITISEGKAEGLLAGGNLSVIISLTGTPFDIDLSGKILFLEEIDEEPYRIDRMLTHMQQAGKFDKIKGIALGNFRNCEPRKINPAFTNSFSLLEVLAERLQKLNVPVVYGLSFGHVKNKFTLPLGISAELDTFTGTIRLLERSVI